MKTASAMYDNNPAALAENISVSETTGKVRNVSVFQNLARI